MTDIAKDDSEKVVNELTGDMVRLIKTVTNTFYKIEESLIVDVLLKYPCLREDDIVDLLHLDKKQTRASLDLLKKDKLVKSITRGDKEDLGPNGGMLKFNYYFINYQVFINVVKYKLDRMRKRIEQDDKLTQDCQFHLCKECDLRFSDLDVPELFDPTTSTLRCKHCGEELVEDEQKIKSLQDRSMVSKFNEQTKFFMDLLRTTDNIKLSEELLTPQPIKLDALEGHRGRSTRTTGGQPWQSNRKEYNLYQESSIKINLDADLEAKKRVKKELPIWVAESTVVTDGNHRESGDLGKEKAEAQRMVSSSSLHKDDYISQLIQNEVMTSSAPTSGSSSPTYEEDGDGEREGEGEEEEEDRWVVMVGGEPMALSEIDGDDVARMSESEKYQYDKMYREYCDSIMM